MTSMRWGAALLASLSVLSLSAQEVSPSPPPPLRLNDAVALAVAHYPAALAAALQARQAAAAVNVQRGAYLPDLRLVAQVDQATDNNTPGLLIGNGLPTISGPVAARYGWEGGTTSSAGAVFSWEAYDFGRRAAGVAFYQALAERSQQAQRQTELEVGAHAADVFLAGLAAQTAHTLAAADLERWQTLARMVHVLIDQQLRPGADGSRVDAEVAAARLALARAQDDLERQRAALAEAVGQPLAEFTLAQPDLLFRSVAEVPGSGAAPDLELTPLLRAQQFSLRASAATLDAVRLGDRPRFFLLASAYGRGTSLLAGTRDVAVAGGAAPLSAGNWVVGAGIEYSFTRHWQSRGEQSVARDQNLQDQARYRQLSGGLQLAWRQANADLEAAREGLSAAPVELDAAQTGEAQARARYRAGLAAVVDLANAEEILAKAQTDSLLTHLQLWRALLKLNFVDGDLQPFLALAGGR